MKVVVAIIVGVMLQCVASRADASELDAANAFGIAVGDLHFILPAGFTLSAVRSRSNHTSLWITDTSRTESFMTVLLYTNFEAEDEVLALHPDFILDSCVSSASGLVLRRYTHIRRPSAIVTAAGRGALARFQGPWDITLVSVMDLFPEEAWEGFHDEGGRSCSKMRSDLSFYVEVPESH